MSYDHIHRNINDDISIRMDTSLKRYTPTVVGDLGNRLFIIRIKIKMC